MKFKRMNDTNQRFICSVQIYLKNI
uniref:Uncharacterized protein n=1 Tax=Rhizophora mucronata TaxID=61149 RepID=A0A2P2NWM9_RHIMU